MNGVQKVIKYCAMAFAVFLSVVILGTIVTVVLGVTTGIAGVNAITGEDKERINLSERYSPEEMAELGIHSILVDCNAEIVVEQGTELSIEAFDVTDEYEIRLANGTFSIVQDAQDFGIHFFWFEDVTAHEKVIVTIPAEAELDELKLLSGSGKVAVSKVVADAVTLDSGSGSVSAEGIRAKQLFMDSGSGRVTVFDTNAEDTKLYTGSGGVTVERCELGKFRLDSGSGSVRMKEIVAENANVETGSGAVSLEGSLTGKCKFDTGSGSLTLRLDGVEEEYLVSAECGSGTFRINGKKLDDGSYGTNVKGEIRIDSGSGSVNVEFNTPTEE